MLFTWHLDMGEEFIKRVISLGTSNELDKKFPK